MYTYRIWTGLYASGLACQIIWGTRGENCLFSLSKTWLWSEKLRYLNNTTIPYSKRTHTIYLLFYAKFDILPTLKNGGLLQQRTGCIVPPNASTACLEARNITRAVYIRVRSASTLPDIQIYSVTDNSLAVCLQYVQSWQMFSWRPGYHACIACTQSEGTLDICPAPVSNGLSMILPRHVFHLQKLISPAR